MVIFPTLYLIAGSNGAGKTTFAQKFLPEGIQCLNFLNADLIAKGISPFDPVLASLRAGRLLLGEFDRNIAAGVSFGLESTLSGLTYLERLRDAKNRGFRLVIYYLWIGSVEVAIQRIAQRVAKGGHHVPAADVRRRFGRSVRHFFNHYRPLADEFSIFDNQGRGPELVAFGTATAETVVDAEVFRAIRFCHEQAQ